MFDFLGNAVLKNYAPVIVRQLLIALGAFLAAKGLPSESIEWLTGEGAVIAVLGIGTSVFAAIWGLIKRPSAEGMKAAKAVDATPVVAGVVIETPVGEPNVKVSVKKNFTAAPDKANVKGAGKKR